MPKHGQLVLPHSGEAVRPEDLVIAAPAEAERGADAVSSGAGRADAEHNTVRHRQASF